MVKKVLDKNITIKMELRNIVKKEQKDKNPLYSYDIYIDGKKFRREHSETTSITSVMKVMKMDMLYAIKKYFGIIN